MRFLKETQNGQRIQPNGKIIRSSTIDGYETLFKHIQNYQVSRDKVLRIKDWDYLNTREKIAETNYWKRFYFDFTNYLFYELDHHDNHVGQQMKLLRAFFMWLEKEFILMPGSFYHQFYKTHEDIPVIVLTPERLSFLIHNKEFEQSLDKRLRKMKDMFVFGCTTALRFSDLMALNFTNIETIGKNKYVVVNSQKTNTRSRIYLPDFAKDILHKYRRRKKSLFPPISMVNFNIAIKKIALLAGWTEEITKTRSKQGTPVVHYKDATKKINYRFCDSISSHTMRRTAITTMLRMGMNEINVRLISGHKANSTSFYRYVNYADGFIDEEMDKYYAKLNSIPPSL
jgi:integrase